MAEIGRASTAMVSAHNRTRVSAVRLFPREKRQCLANFNGTFDKARTISAATWMLDVAVSVAMSDAAITGRSSSVMIEACYPGTVGLRCQVTLDNGEVYNQQFVVQVLWGPNYGDQTMPAGPTSLSVEAP